MEVVDHNMFKPDIRTNTPKFHKHVRNVRYCVCLIVITLGKELESLFIRKSAYDSFV